MIIAYDYREHESRLYLFILFIIVLQYIKKMHWKPMASSAKG